MLVALDGGRVNKTPRLSGRDRYIKNLARPVDPDEELPEFDADEEREPDEEDVGEDGESLSGRDL